MKRFSAILRHRRALLNPERVGAALPEAQGRRAAGGGVSQTALDDALMRTRGTYQRLESGRYRNPPIDLLRDYARLLRCTEQDWAALCRYGRGTEPPEPLWPDSGTALPGEWQQAVDLIDAPAYATDRAYNVVAHNEQWAAMFPPGCAPTNTMEWMLLDPGARETLLDWEERWAPWVVPQLRAAVRAFHDDPVLQDIEHRVIADPMAGPIYAEFGDTYIHPDGATRPLVHAKLGPGWVTMCAAGPMAAPGARIMILIFRQGDERPAPCPPLRASCRDNRLPGRE